MTKKAKNWWGFDTAGIDNSVRPQDDFYAYANRGWIKKTKIPPEEARWGSFNILHFETERRLKKIAGNAKDPLVGRLYRSALDIKYRNALGIRPLEPLLKQARAIKNKKEFLKTLAQFHVLGISGFWGTFVDQDSRQSSRYILHLWQDGLGMPERDYYLLESPEQKRVRSAYMLHIKKLSGIAGMGAKDAENAAKTIMEIETELARASMSKEDIRDAEKVYHKKTIIEFSRLCPEIDWQKYFTLTGARTKRLIVGQPKFFKAVSKIIKATPLEKLKIYMEWHLLNDSAHLLSEPFVRENFDFYSRTLAGVKKMRPSWRRALGAVNSSVGFAMGKLYVERYFTRSAKKAIDALVVDLYGAYEARIKKLDWMSTPTKRKAIKKLRAMQRKIGYPSKWKEYRGLVFKNGDFFGNMLRASEFEHKRQMKKLRGPVDRSEWHMSPQMVNAYCSFGLNEIVFPAAILQPPFFSPDADDAVNYGAIGSVIGHEITHGFDDQGSKFDGKGNRQTWWTKQDRARFEKKTRALVKQFNEYTVAGGIKVNGQLTLGENIADLGGASIAFDAYQRRLRKTGRKVIDGLTPEQRYFLALALFERENARPEFQKMLVLTNVHAPGQFRINGPASNLPEFYEAFGVKKGDKLYRPPSSRAKIW